MHGMVKRLASLACLCVLSVAFADEQQDQEPAKFLIDFKDGSSVLAVPSLSHLSLKTADSEIRVPLKSIVTLRSKGDSNDVIVQLQNGDKLTGVLNTGADTLELATVLGKVSVGVKQVQRMLFQERMSLPPSLNKGVSAYYSFDGHANDISGRRRHGTVHGATPAEDRFGKPGRCYGIAGTSFISLDSKAFHGLEEFSIAVWVFFEELNTKW